MPKIEIDTGDGVFDTDSDHRSRGTWSYPGCPAFHAEITFLAIDRLAFPEEIDPAVMQRRCDCLDPVDELVVFIHSSSLVFNQASSLPNRKISSKWKNLYKSSTAAN